MTICACEHTVVLIMRSAGVYSVCGKRITTIFYEQHSPNPPKRNLQHVKRSKTAHQTLHETTSERHKARLRETASRNHTTHHHTRTNTDTIKENRGSQKRSNTNMSAFESPAALPSRTIHDTRNEETTICDEHNRKTQNTSQQTTITILPKQNKTKHKTITNTIANTIQ